MNRLLTILFLLSTAIAAQVFSPKAEVSYRIEPLFPSRQNMFVGKGTLTFLENNTDPEYSDSRDTLVPIRTYFNWLPGHSLTGKFELLTILHFGTKIKLEQHFNHYEEAYFNENEAQLISVLMLVNMYRLRAGLFFSATIFNYVKVEPEVNILFVKNHFRYYIPYFSHHEFRYSINKVGVFSALNFLYSRWDNVHVGLEIAYENYSEYSDFMLNPYVRLKINNLLSGNAGVTFSPMTASLKPALGVTISIPRIKHTP